MNKHKIDGHKLHLHPARVAMWNVGEDIAPIYIEVSLTNACNQMCIFCAFDYTKKEFRYLDTDVLLKRLDEMYSLGVRSICFAGEGEPLLHKDFEKILKSAHEIGYDLAISTNGILLTEDKIEKILPYLTWIRFSINGWENKYSEIHGTLSDSKTDYRKVINNVKKCVEYKHKNNLDIAIGVQTLFMSENREDIINIVYDISKIGADYISLKPIITHLSSINQKEQKLTDLEVEILYNAANHFNKENFSVIMRRHPYEHVGQNKNYGECLGLPFFCEIASDGGIYTCGPFLLNGDYCYGNIYNNTFLEIYESDKRKQVLKRIKSMDINSKCMNACRLDRINEYLWEFKNLPNSVNFI